MVSCRFKRTWRSFQWFHRPFQDALSFRQNLTVDEYRFLLKKKKILYCIDPLWAPIEYLDADGLGTFSYVWKADGSVISGASGSSYVLTQAEVGKTITVEVSYTDGEGTDEELSSAPTPSVTAINDSDPDPETDNDLFIGDDQSTVDVVELFPTRNPDDETPTRLNINFDEGDGSQVVILDLSHWEGTELPEIAVSGKGQLVVRGAGRFLGNNDELGDDPEQDHDNILGDDQAQIFFFGPGDDIIRGAGGDDIVASSGGNDQLYGDAGDDLVIGGNDADILSGGLGNDILQGGLSDAGIWQFSLDNGQGLHVQFAPSRTDLPENAGHLDVRLYEGQSWIGDARVAFTSAEYDRLAAHASLFHAVIGELPTLDELNIMISWQANSLQLAEVAYDYYRHQTQIQEEDFRGQVKSLIDLVWGVDVASEELIQLGVNYIENGGSWSEGLLALSLHDNHRQQMKNDLGELQLHQKYSISETGWSADVSDDQLFGGYGDDILVGGFGSDLLDGGKGEDIAVQLGNSYDHLFRISSQGQLELFHQTSL